MVVPSHAFQKWMDDAGVSTLRLSSAERKRIENALYDAYVAGDSDGYTRGFSEGYATLSPIVTNLWSS